MEWNHDDVYNTWLRGSVDWATMASLIQLSLPVLQISSVYNPFSSRFSFRVAFHHCSVDRFNGEHTIPPISPPGDHARVQKSWHLLE